MKKMFILLFTLFLSVTMFAQQAKHPFLQGIPVNQPDSQIVREVTDPGGSRGAVIFTHGFEGTTGTAFATGWTTIPSTGGTAGRTRWATGTGTLPTTEVPGAPHGGTRLAYISYTTAAHDAWVITPAINLTAGTTYAIEFWVQMVGYDAPEELEMWVGTAATAAGMTQKLWEEKTNDITPWQRIMKFITPTTTGNIYIGFHNTSTDQYYTFIDDITVSVANTNDLELKAVYPYTQVPIGQTLAATLPVQVNSNCTAPQTNVVVSLKQNGTQIGATTPMTVASTAIVKLDIPTGSAAIPLGDNSLTYTLTQNETDENPADNTITRTFTGTPNKFATDNGAMSTYWYGTATNYYGNIYSFTKTTTLNQIESYHYYNASYYATTYGIAVYAVNADTIAATPIASASGLSKATTATNWFTYTFPTPLSLPAGKYFIAVTGLNCCILGDANTTGRFGYVSSGTALASLSGALFVRLNVDLPQNDIAVVADNPLLPFTKIPASQAAGAIINKMPFPATLTAQAKNTGLAQQTGITFSATFDGTNMGTSAPIATLAPFTTSAAMTITPPAMMYPYSSGNHNFVYKVQQSETDAYPADNSATFTLEIGNTYALDNKVLCDNGGGSTTTITIGNIFPIYNNTTLNQVILGFSSNPSYAGALSLSLYKMTDATNTGARIYTQTFTRPASDWITITLTTPQALTAGDYYLCVDQQTTSNMGLSFDTRPNAVRAYSKTYSSTGAAGAVSPITNFGAMAIRMVVTPASACTATAPTNLSVVPSFGSATFSWTGNATGYIVTLNNGTTSTLYYATTNTLTVTGLLSNVTYTWSVKAVCEDTGNPSSTGTSFSVPSCSNVTLPYYYGFEDGTHNSSAITCYTQEGTVGTYEWTVNQTFTDYNRTPRTGTKNAFLHYSASRWLFRQVDMTPGLYRFSVWARQDGATATNASITLKYGTTSTAAGMVNTICPQTGLVNGDYQKISGKFTITTAGTYSFGIYGEINGTPLYISIDDIALEKIPDVDMAAVSITGPNTVAALDQNNYTVTVKNEGVLSVQNFTVKVFTDGGIELGTTTVPTAVLPDATLAVTVPATFPISTIGAAKIKGVVIATGDGIAANNETPLFAVTVLSECTDLANAKKVTIGTGTTNYYTIPVNTFYGYSYSQQIFNASEIGFPAGTKIISVGFNYVYSVGQVKPNQQVYIGNTTQSTFSTTSNFIPLNQMTLVYSGDVDYNNSQQWSTIYFNNPFTYTGGNLVVAVVNGHGTYVSSSNVTFSTHTATSKTVHYYRDGTPIDPAAPLTGTPSSGVLAYRNNIQFNAETLKTFTLNPNNIIGEGATVTLSPDPVTCGSSATVTITADDCHNIAGVKFNGVSQPVQTTYNFPNQNVPFPLIEVTTGAPTYDIIATAGANGTIDPSGTVPVNRCANQKFNFIPNTGYVVDYFVVDGVKKPKAGYYTFADVKEPHTISVAFKEAPYHIYFTHEGNGEVVPVGNEALIPFGEIGMDEGGMQLFTFVPSPNNEIQAVYIDGMLNQGALIAGSYMFVNVHENHLIHVIFKLVDNTIVATAGANGTITPHGNVPVPYGNSIDFDCRPDVGYVIDQIFVDNNPIPGVHGESSYTYTFVNVQGNHTILVTFTKATVMIHATSSGCGASTIFPLGEVSALYNDIVIFTFAPELGCKVSDVIIDGESYPNAIPTGSYTFFYVTEPHTIHVSYEPITFPITAAINAHGTINDEGVTYVDYGTNKTYSFSTTAGYKIANVFVDGANNLTAVANKSYTFTNVTAPHSISVITAPMTYTIVASAGLGGFITPSGDITATYGESRMFTFAAASGYVLDKVFIDGAENGEAALNGSYAFVNISKDHTIKVTFKKVIFKIASHVSGSGAIEPSGIIDVNYGENVTYYITPDEGYKVSNVLVNGDDQGPVNTYTFTEVVKDGTIEVIFISNSITGINPQTIDGITIYSQGNTVYIDNHDLLNIRDVSITDMLGRVIWQGKVSDLHNSITLNVSSGIYAVRVVTDLNVTSTKVPIQK